MPNINNEFTAIATVLAGHNGKPMGSKGFGFVRLNHDGSQAFIRIERIEEAGFASTDYAVGAQVTVDIAEKHDGRQTVTLLRQIGEKLSPNLYSTKVVDRNKDNGKSVVMLNINTNRGPQLVEYRVMGADGKQVGTAMTLTEAREAMGKIIEPPKPVNFGEKTNIGGKNWSKGPGGQKEQPGRKIGKQKAGMMNKGGNKKAA
jgi:cold shock CspA family protein